MKILRRLIWGNDHLRWTGIPHTTAVCTLSGLTRFYSQLMAAAEENPEHVGYADFMPEGRPCGAGVYCAPLGSFYSCLTIDQKEVRVDSATLTHLLEGLATNKEIDDLRTEWQVRFYSPELVPEALLRILRTVCGCPEGTHLEIDQWWT